MSLEKKGESLKVVVSSPLNTRCSGIFCGARKALQVQWEILAETVFCAKALGQEAWAKFEGQIKGICDKS